MFIGEGDVKRVFAIAAMCFAVVGSPTVTRAETPDDHVTATVLNAGVSTFAGTQGLYGRFTHRFGTRIWVHAVGHWGPAPWAAPVEAPWLFLEGTLEGRAARPDYEKILGGRVSPFHRGWRLGAFFRSYVSQVNDTGMVFQYRYATTKVLAGFAGYGIGIDSRLLRATLGLDLIAAPLISHGDYFDEGGNMQTFSGELKRFGGRLGMLTNFGPKRYGFNFDVGFGWLPGVQSEFYALGVFGFYLGI